MKFSIRTMLVITTVLFFGLIAFYQNQRVAQLESELARYGIAKPLATSSPLVNQDRMEMHPFGVVVEPVRIEADVQSEGGYTDGLKVKQVENDGPAFQAGIFEGDIIVAMAGWKIESVNGLDFVVNAKKNGYQPGDIYVVERNGKLYQGAIQW